MAVTDPFNLGRFVEAQRSVYGRVLAELRGGKKTSHWMWFIFPQLRGLGRSSTAEFYGIASLAEARDYLAHPELGERLRECCRVLLQSDLHDADAIFGFPDALKLRSSMTLFAHAAPEEPLFRQVLDRLYGGEEDPATSRLLKSRLLK